MRTEDILLNIEVIGFLHPMRMDSHTESSQSVDFHLAALRQRVVHFGHKCRDNSQDVRLSHRTAVADAGCKCLDINAVSHYSTGVPMPLFLTVLTIVLVQTIID